MATGNITIRFEPTIPINVTKKAFEQALAKVGLDMLAQAVQGASKPFPPASQPFRPPHRRKGDHVAGLGVTSSRGGISLRTNVTGNAPHSKFLNEGTRNMFPRLTWEPVLFQPGSTTIKKKWINAIALEARKLVRTSRGLPANAPLGR